MPTGMPDARMVLMKGFDERGFVFYTNLDSIKGHELAAAPKAALTFYWKSLQRQVRLRGNVEAVSKDRSRRLFRHALAHGANRRLGEQTILGAGKPPRLRKGCRDPDREIRDRHGAAAAAIGRASASCRYRDRVLAGAAIPAARSHRLRASEFGQRRGPRRGFIHNHRANNLWQRATNRAARSF